MSTKRKPKPRSGAIEKRASGDPIFAPQMVSGLATGGHVTPRAAENLTTVYACVAAISTAIAGLPMFVYRTATEGRVEEPAHPLALLVRRGPNRWQTWPDFTEWALASVLLRGNAVIEIVTDAHGGLAALKPIPWEFCNVSFLPSGQLVYDVQDVTSIWGGTGRTRRLLADEVIHIRDRTDDGLIGRSRLHRAAGAVGAAMSLQEFTGSMWRNGVHPSGAIKLDRAMTTETKAALREAMQPLFTGPTNAAKMMILDQGMAWETISVSPEDAELLASRRFTVEELARLYGVPPVVIGDLSNSSFTNAETMLRAFAQLTLRHWIRKLEAEFARSLLADDYHVEFDLSAFLRGDPETRWKSHQIAISTGVLDVNEVREIEGYNPKPQAAEAAQ
ncbi:phage portal protein [Rhodomicrobium vannielii ATCC 17100]|uniref:phage portal protein n=1 Tax=Rhodomicrobium vannielii TaxID=1069 RepID=UPI001919DD6D|nr:phage portal protein [Rhodomicrobium vannielii]MBJ7535438.1 phage portal protein [Rhodomicrobium vannielii ATCC 17100]